MRFLIFRRQPGLVYKEEKGILESERESEREREREVCKDS
jgi:hypothetical protein